VTCIVGLEHEGRVYIGGDSAGVSGWSLTVRADSQVFLRDVPHIGPAAFGFTSSFRMGQIIRYAFEPPSPKADAEPADIDAYLVAEFIPALRKAFNDHGYEGAKDGRKEGGTFLLGIAGCLYCVDSDYQVGRAVAPYDAVGCGNDVAIGALHVEMTGGVDTKDGTARDIVVSALEAAEAHNAGVRGPFHVVSA
jgi:hypothetical protein